MKNPFKRWARSWAAKRRFDRELAAWRAAGGVVSKKRPCLDDYADSSGAAKGHYFHQDLFVAQAIFTQNPPRHVDIGSRVDGFVAHVAAFRQIEVFDVRPLISEHPNIIFRQVDFMSPPKDLALTTSLSCLHTLEHFGLGRYGDPIDPQGHRKGFENLVGLLAPKGLLYLSFPVGQPRVEFNAHRVFDPREVLAWAGERLTLVGFSLVDDRGDFHPSAKIEDAIGLHYGCGIYTFQKRP